MSVDVHGCGHVVQFDAVARQYLPCAECILIPTLHLAITPELPSFAAWAASPTSVPRMRERVFDRIRPAGVAVWVPRVA